MSDSDSQPSKADFSVRRWVNQYMELTKTAFPDYLFSPTTQDQEKAVIQKIIGLKEKYQEVFIEIGSGSGGHIIKLGEQNPEVLCIGVELRFKRAYRTIEKAQEYGINNICLYRGDAREFLKHFPDGFFSRLYCNFPDPWERKRWLKHRLLSAETLPEVSRILKSGGSLRFKTDHEEYFDSVTESVKKLESLSLIKHTRDLHSSDFLDGNILSEFEQLFLSKKLPIYFLEGVRA